MRHRAGDFGQAGPDLGVAGHRSWVHRREPLGHSGVVELVDRLAAHARALADGIAAVPKAEILNDVVFTQVCAVFGDHQCTRAVTARLLAEGTAWISGSRWHGRDVPRISVSNWSTDADDVTASVDAVRRATSVP
jgi:glutamate/tyrosine decarboxylase-like PLP-dependent enzyme